MSRLKTKIAVYSNLPSGGAAELAKLNYIFLKKYADITYLSDAEVKPQNLLEYIYDCIYILPKLHKSLSQKITRGVKYVVVYHSWLTKSPHLLRYTSKKKIYICQELMREFYDQKHLDNQSIKEKLINLIRLPIKYIDRKNLKSSNLKVIVNSYFSKSLVDKYYGVKSSVIYPGIEVSLFANLPVLKKRNQIISVGAINKLKGFEFLVHVVSKISASKRPTLVLVGNGGNKQYIAFLNRLAEKLEVKISIKLNLTKPQLVREYLKSKLFMYAPINEPFGVVVQEAMAARLPLVVHKAGGGYAEILSNKNGLIMKSRDPEEWSSESEALLSDNKKLEKYGQYNLQHVTKQYTSDIMNNNLWKAIKSL